MNWLEELLPPLLYEGRLVFRECPRTDASSPEAIRQLETAFDAYRLDIAGTAIEFDAATAIEVSSIVIRTGWALVNHDLPDAEMRRWVSMSHRPMNPSQHLTADLLFRFLPQLHRRALVHRGAEPLAERLGAILREWPLSGVLANLEIGPEQPPAFYGHFGLMQLYAERWASHRNPQWRPDAALDQHVELVLGECARAGPPIGISRTRRHD